MQIELGFQTFDLIDADVLALIFAKLCGNLES